MMKQGKNDGSTEQHHLQIIVHIVCIKMCLMCKGSKIEKSDEWSGIADFYGMKFINYIILANIRACKELWSRLRQHNGNRVIHYREWQWSLAIFIIDFRKCNHSQCGGNYIHQQEESVIWNSYISCIYHEKAVSMAIGDFVVCVCMYVSLFI